MAVTDGKGAQSRDVKVISLEDGGSAIVVFQAKRSANVDWQDGGVSWTIAPQAPDTDFSVKVEHSLVADGDHWVEDNESPFDEPSQGAEEYRIERIRFTNTGAAVTVVVASPSVFSVEEP